MLYWGHIVFKNKQISNKPDINIVIKLITKYALRPAQAQQRIKQGWVPQHIISYNPSGSTEQKAKKMLILKVN